MAVKIITDSTCDLPKSAIKENKLTVAPLKVIFGKKEYIDGVDITAEEFYQKLIEAEELPTTSQVTPEQFITIFEDAKENGDELVCIHISEQMSGTIQSANIAKDHVDYDKIYIFDSGSTSVELGCMAVAAGKMAAEGDSGEKIIEKLSKVKERTVLYGAISTLKYLKKGGRIKASSAIIGEALNIKPIVTISDGLVESIGKARGTKKAMEEIKKMINEANTTLDGKDVYLAHACDEAALAKFKEFLLLNYTPSNIIEGTIGSVVGTHAGPGCIVLAFEQ